MDFAFYLRQFHLAAGETPEIKLDRKGLKLSVDIVLESVALKVYKPEWSGDHQSPLDAVGRIFFSVWVNDKAIQEDRIYYNIHALKVRELRNYRISGRNFAQDFRTEFLKYHKDWPNVSVQYGPLTLMQGWIQLKNDRIQKDVYELVQNFLKISSIIDHILDSHKK
ncbi:hypothetical protein [Chryseobacterium rhizosphaerae]|uniref:hypothetical protein n=1 Tax=Chryseobacterium rhizosphaerae TaxID=395937 RepID=UPI002359FF72|nr:hypothetical protein [Chryseobacterium rhizosphaerae]MDC8101190.1 hypothetical protein [Chryseobacterium rhizosphaerae]